MQIAEKFGNLVAGSTVESLLIGDNSMPTRKELDLHIAGACLHTARRTLRDQIAGERGENKRRLKAILTAVDDAVGAVDRQGLTSDEYFAAASDRGGQGQTAWQSRSAKRGAAENGLATLAA